MTDTMVKLSCAELTRDKSVIGYHGKQNQLHVLRLNIRCSGIHFLSLLKWFARG